MTTYELLKADARAAFAAGYRRLRQQGCGPDEVARYLAAYGLMNRTDRLASFVAAHEFLGQHHARGDLALFVAMELSEGRWEGLLAAGVYEPTFATLAAEAYLEAAAILTRIIDEVHAIHPPDLAPALLYYYAGRRAQDADLLGTAQAELVWGRAGVSAAHGPLYRKAWAEYDGRPQIERELAAQAYCDGFLCALDSLPPEALLCPDLAMAYALQAAARAGNKALPTHERLGLVDLDDPELKRDIVERWSTHQRLALADVHDTNRTPVMLSDDDESLTSCDWIPHFELLLRHRVDGVSLSALAAESGLSREGVRKRIKTAKELVRASHASPIGEAVTQRVSKLQHAAAVLEQILRDGPRLEGLVREEARAAGVRDRTLERAKGLLGIESRKRGFTGGWWWSLIHTTPET